MSRYRSTNWSELWLDMLNKTDRIEAFNVDYWDKKAADYNETILSMKDFTVKQLNSMQLQPDFTVLDIGAGTGRLAIPIAKKVRQVTAVEPSGKMLEILRKTAKEEQVTNIEAINAYWEQLNVYSSIKPHDVVVASLSLFMEDIATELQKISDAAERTVYLFVSASEWIDADLKQKIDYQLEPGFADHIYLLNILDELDIYAKCEILDFERIEKFKTVEEAAAKYSKTYKVSLTKQAVLHDYLKNRMEFNEGQFRLKQNKKVAMIWWRNNQ